MEHLYYFLPELYVAHCQEIKKFRDLIFEVFFQWWVTSVTEVVVRISNKYYDIFTEDLGKVNFSLLGLLKAFENLLYHRLIYHNKNCLILKFGTC